MKIDKKIVLIASSILILFVLILLVILITTKHNDIQQEIDTTPPLIVLDDVYAVKTGYNKNLVDVIMSADDIDPNPKREILGEYDFNTAGEYHLTYKVEDNSGNVATKDFTLKVKDNYSYSENTILFSDAISKYKNDNTKIRN